MDHLPPFRSRQGQKNGYGIMKEHFLRCPWFEVYDMIEWFLQDSDSLMNDAGITFLNNILERENSAYRVVGREVAEITDENEIKAIEDALAIPEDPVRQHISRALQFLSDREAPDYRNSIKEAISAVEASCRLVSGLSNATLGDALKKIPNIHPALQKSFLALYGFTSDSNGIRHSLMDESTLTYADAKFMLSTCSAFVSYLHAESIK
jgi:AbiJ N-terminal domain 4